MSGVPDFTFRRSRPCLRECSNALLRLCHPSLCSSAIYNEKIVTARYAGSLRTGTRQTEPQVTVSVPVDSNNYWYGVLGMSIPVRNYPAIFRNAIDKNLDGEYQLYDSKLRFLTSSNPDHPTGNIFDPRELALLAQAMEHDTRVASNLQSLC